MWLFTTDGFFSAVAHRDNPGTILVRSRVREDAQSLVASVGQGEVIETPDGDYRYRVLLPRNTWSAHLAAAGDAIDYPNFKNAVATRQGADRARAYADVWSVMFQLQQAEVEGDATAGDSARAADRKAV